MEKLCLKDVQELSFKILHDVHSFCIKHNIRYSLAYGTLIGAIRHKGFIPWDDDVDIIMPRLDFERFSKEYISENGYKFLGPDSDDCLIPYGRVYDTKRTLVRTNAPWSRFETGIWIDVFPVDGVEDNIEVFREKLYQLQKTAKLLSYKRNCFESLLTTHPLKRKFTWFVKRLLTMQHSFNDLLKTYNGIIKSVDFEVAEYWGQLGCYDGGTKKEHNPKEDFLFTIPVEFEGHEFLAMNGYDNVLRRYYGDYMQLPPENERVPKQESYMTFYWKQ